VTYFMAPKPELGRAARHLAGYSGATPQGFTPDSASPREAGSANGDVERYAVVS